MDHPKDQSLFSLGLPGLFIYIPAPSFATLINGEQYERYTFSKHERKFHFVAQIISFDHFLIIRALSKFFPIRAILAPVS